MSADAGQREQKASRQVARVVGFLSGNFRLRRTKPVLPSAEDDSHGAASADQRFPNLLDDIEFAFDWSCYFGVDYETVKIANPQSRLLDRGASRPRPLEHPEVRPALSCQAECEVAVPSCVI